MTDRQSKMPKILIHPRFEKVVQRSGTHNIRISIWPSSHYIRRRTNKKYSRNDFNKAKWMDQPWCPDTLSTVATVTVWPRWFNMKRDTAGGNSAASAGSYPASSCTDPGQEGGMAGCLERRGEQRCCCCSNFSFFKVPFKRWMLLPNWKVGLLNYVSVSQRNLEKNKIIYIYISIFTVYIAWLICGTRVSCLWQCAAEIYSATKNTYLYFLKSVLCHLFLLPR